MTKSTILLNKSNMFKQLTVSTVFAITLGSAVLVAQPSFAGKYGDVAGYENSALRNSMNDKTVTSIPKLTTKATEKAQKLMKEAIAKRTMIDTLEENLGLRSSALEKNKAEIDYKAKRGFRLFGSTKSDKQTEAYQIRNLNRSAYDLQLEAVSKDPMQAAKLKHLNILKKEFAKIEEAYSRLSLARAKEEVINDKYQHAGRVGFFSKKNITPTQAEINSKMNDIRIADVADSQTSPELELATRVQLMEENQTLSRVLDQAETKVAHSHLDKLSNAVSQHAKAVQVKRTAEAKANKKALAEFKKPYADVLALASAKVQEKAEAKTRAQFAIDEANTIADMNHYGMEIEADESVKTSTPKKKNVTFERTVALGSTPSDSAKLNKQRDKNVKAIRAEWAAHEKALLKSDAGIEELEAIETAKMTQLADRLSNAAVSKKRYAILNKARDKSVKATRDEWAAREKALLTSDIGIEELEESETPVVVVKEKSTPVVSKSALLGATPTESFESSSDPELVDSDTPEVKATVSEKDKTNAAQVLAKFAKAGKIKVQKDREEAAKKVHQVYAQIQRLYASLAPLMKSYESYSAKLAGSNKFDEGLGQAEEQTSASNESPQVALNVGAKKPSVSTDDFSVGMSTTEKKPGLSRSNSAF